MYKYYTEENFDYKCEVQVKGEICGSKIAKKDGRYCSSSAFNPRKHLRRVHPEQYDELEKR